MTTILRFGLKSLLRRPVVGCLLTLCLGLSFGLPFAIKNLVSEISRQLNLRAQETPLVLGSEGSETDLVFHALFFVNEPPSEITVADLQAVADQQSVIAAPLHLAATVRRRPVIGTDGNYFRLRKLELSSGEPISRLGDAVLGAEAAEQLGIVPGSKIDTDIESLFTLSGGVPVRLRVTGVMARTGTADDAGIFVSLETSWLIAGLGHGHSNPEKSHENETVARNERGAIEVTDENVDSFHFHGRRERFPLSAVLIKPNEEKARLLLVGQYFEPINGVQLVEADRTLNELFAVVLRLRQMFEANAILAGGITMILSLTVIALTMRLRWSEVKTLSRIGFSRLRISMLFGAEFTIVIAMATLVAIGLSLVAGWLAPSILLWFFR